MTTLCPCTEALSEDFQKVLYPCLKRSSCLVPNKVQSHDAKKRNQKFCPYVEILHKGKTVYINKTTTVWLLQDRGGHLGANEPTVALKCFFVALKRLFSIFKS